MSVDEIDHTYIAALQHDHVDVGNAKLLGVVRKPTPWFHSEVDKNLRKLGPPTDLLEEFEQVRNDFKMRGLCDEGAHNSAWEEIDFEDRYLDYLDSSEEAGQTIEEVIDLLEQENKVFLVCYENTEKKRCHRVPLMERIVEEWESRENR